MNFQNIFNLENLLNWVFAHGIRVAVILIVAWLTTRFTKILISRVLRNVIRKGLELSRMESRMEQEREKTLEKVSVSILKVAIWIVAVLTVLPELGINIGPLLAGLGVGGLALGFGARSLIQDYISGLFILLEDHYRVGEEVTVAGAQGKVKDFNLRRTVIEDSEGTLHYIPNSQVKQASNFSRK